MSSSSPLGNEPAEPIDPAGVVLRRERRQRRWTQMRLVHELQTVARDRGQPVPTEESLIAMISRWENGHRVPDEHNRQLLCLALGISVSALGLPKDPDLWGRPNGGLALHAIPLSARGG